MERNRLNGRCWHSNFWDPLANRVSDRKKTCNFSKHGTDLEFLQYSRLKIIQNSVILQHSKSSKLMAYFILLNDKDSISVVKKFKYATELKKNRDHFATDVFCHFLKPSHRYSCNFKPPLWLGDLFRKRCPISIVEKFLTITETQLHEIFARIRFPFFTLLKFVSFSSYISYVVSIVE